MASSKGWQSIILAVSVICALNFLFKNNPREVVQINVFEGWWYPYSGRDISIARKLSGKVFLEAANYQLKIDFVREYQAIERGTEGTRAILKMVKNPNQQLLGNYKKRLGVWVGTKLELK
ncbi:uncharacterized protein LOC133735548 isoform X9 [Rosa rugosa]|uniref:uncharacterized protein LOC133735548 isoform X9 n=1 Tax=Rosa rugosa TaxID=74645 RepID=UPI002B4087B3|nr:uncharacterized protein LOC133735548 isoform X9 [Rosa rugosa]